MKKRTIERLIAVAAGALVAAAGLAPAAAADVPPPAHGRAWELVSDPSASSSAPPLIALGVDARGDRIAFMRMGPAPQAPVSAVITAGLASRGADGWHEKAVGYPYPGGAIWDLAPNPHAATPDLSTWFWISMRPFVPGAPGDGTVTAWYRAAPDGTPTLLSGGGGATDRIFASADGERVVLQTSAALVDEDSVKTEGSQLYELSGGGARLLGVDEAGDPVLPCGQATMTTLTAPNPTSRDGRRVFFTSTRCWPYLDVPARVFLHEDGASTEISASQCERPDCGPPAEVAFAGATPDGAVAYLVTAAQLTDDDVDESSDVYRYEVGDGSLTRVSAGAAPADAVVTRAYPSDDGGRVYFLARGQLVPGQGTEGSPNAYVADGAGLRFIGTLAPDDGWAIAEEESPRLPTVELTPGSGDRLMLITGGALRPEDTDAARDVYLYDAAEGGPPLLVSKTAHGGDAEVPVRTDSVFFHLVHRFAQAPPRTLVADGRRVLFMTAESLVPEDTDSATDVYEWFDGEVGLVSSGGGAHDAMLLGASPDGASVFVTTPERLASADDDSGDYDIYAARLGGGFPEPAAPPAECADGCPPAPPSRLARPDLPTVGHRGQRSVALRLRAPTARERARMVARGRLALAVRAPAAGRVSAVARARLGGRVRIVGRGRVRVAKAGKTVTVAVPLSSAARRRLAAGRDLSVRVVLRHSRLGGAALQTRLVLRGSP
jgi:hypothetical protein